ncbi:MAG TPA: prolipoprotein diacylglyceryl transferase family protein [Iamia sp.]
MSALIPYRAFPQIELLGLTFKTFSLMSVLGFVVGAAFAARHVSRRTPLEFQAMFVMASQIAIAGFVGARVTWVLTHTDEVRSPIEALEIWQGGLQFSGGFIGVALAAALLLRAFPRNVKWIAADGLSVGTCLAIGLGRVGCIAFGEHFGRPSTFLLAVRYDGGIVKETSLGDRPLRLGDTFHHTALYDLFVLVTLLAVLLMVARRASTGQLTAVFCCVYGTCRFLTDFLRVNDQRVLGLTGAQFLMLVVVAAGLWITLRVVPSLRRDGQQQLTAPSACP